MCLESMANFKKGRTLGYGFTVDQSVSLCNIGSLNPATAAAVWGKVMFLYLCVILFVGVGVSV